MAEGDLIVKMMTQGEAKVYQSLQELAKSWAGVDDATKKAGDDARRVAKEQAELGRQAATVWQQTRTPLEQYNQKLGQLSGLLQKGKLDQDTYNRAVVQAKHAYQDAAGAGQKAFGPDLLGTLAKAGAAYLGLSASIREVTGALTHHRQAQAEAAQSHLGVADIQAEALMNLSAGSDTEQARIVKQVEAMATKVRPAGGLKAAWQVFSAALSASGGNAAQALPAAEAALRFSPVNQQTAGQIGAALPDLASMTGMGPMANLGYITEIGRLAVSTNQQQVSGYLVPAAKQLGAFGATPEEAAAAVSAVQKAMGQRDVEGRLTGTAVVQLAKQMEEKLGPTAKPKEMKAKLPFDLREGESIMDVMEELSQTSALSPKQIWDTEKDVGDYLKEKVAADTAAKKTAGLDTFTKRLRYLQQNPEARAEFLADASFEAPSMIAIQELLGARQGRTAKYMAENLADLAPRTKWEGLALERTKRIQQTPTQQITALSSTVEGVTEQLSQSQLGVANAIAGVLSKEKADKLLRASGAGYLESRVADFAFTPQELLGGQAEDRFASVMRARVKELRTDRGGGAFMGPGMGGMALPDTATTDPARLQAANLLESGVQQILAQAQATRALLETAQKLDNAASKLEQTTNKPPRLSEPTKDQ